MKKSLILCLTVLTVSSFTDPANPLVGRWQQKFANGRTVLGVFRANGNFDIFINGKTFVSGKYAVLQDTLRLADASCGLDYYGTYKLAFFASDSLRWTVIQDTCRARSGGFRNVPTAGRVPSDLSK